MQESKKQEVTIGRISVCVLRLLLDHWSNPLSSKEFRAACSTIFGLPVPPKVVAKRIKRAHIPLEEAEELNDYLKEISGGLFISTSTQEEILRIRAELRRGIRAAEQAFHRHTKARFVLQQGLIEEVRV